MTNQQTDTSAPAPTLDPKVEAEGTVALINSLSLKIDELQASVDSAIARTKAAAQPEMDDLEAQRSAAMDRLQRLAVSHRETLFASSKTLKTKDGKVSLRLGNKTFSFPDDATLLRRLKRRRLIRKYVTMKPVINKEALRHASDEVRRLLGITDSQTERMTVTLSKTTFKDNEREMPLRRDLSDPS